MMNDKYKVLIHKYRYIYIQLFFAIFNKSCSLDSLELISFTSTSSPYTSAMIVELGIGCWSYL